MKKKSPTTASGPAASVKLSKLPIPPVIVMAVLTASALLLSACGSSSAHTSPASATPAVYTQETAAADYYEPGAGVSRNGTATEASEISDSVAMSSGNYKAESPSVKTGRKLIRNVNMDVETNDFDSLLTGINNKIAALGGYTEQSNISGRRAGYQNQPYPRNAYITARIPADKLDIFVSSVEDTGNVINKSESTDDVTLRYSDIESRKKSLTVEQDRLWALLEKADTLEAVIALEQRLSDIRYELESMESQLKLYDNQVDYSTVTLNINEVIQYTPTAPETVTQRINRGFANTTDSMSRFFVNLFVLLVSLSPVWIPAAVIAVVVILWLRRRRKLRKNAVVTPKSAAARPENTVVKPNDGDGKSDDTAAKPDDMQKL